MLLNITTCDMLKQNVEVTVNSIKILVSTGFEGTI